MKYTRGMFERRRALLPLQQPSDHGNDKTTRVLDEPPTAVGMAGMLTVNTEVIVVMVAET